MPEHKEPPRWFKILVALLVVMAVSCTVLAYQLTRRNGQLDDLEGQISRVETAQVEVNAAVVEIKSDTKRIGAIADRFAEGDPEQAAALQDLFRKINAIYEAVVPEGER